MLSPLAGAQSCLLSHHGSTQRCVAHMGPLANPARLQAAAQRGHPCSVKQHTPSGRSSLSMSMYTILRFALQAVMRDAAPAGQGQV
jgi:hypothetical protein